MKFRDAGRPFLYSGTIGFLRVSIAVLVLILVTCSRKNDPPVWNNPLDPQGINWHPPVIAAIHDTVVAIHDTVIEEISARDTTDSNRAIVEYYWSTSAKGWTDSSTGPLIKIAPPAAGGSTQITVGARETDGSLGEGKFHILFKHPPSSLAMIAPVNADSNAAQWNTFDGSSEKGSVVCRFSCADTDSAGANDTLSYTLLFGKDSAAPARLPSVKVPADTLTAIDTSATYYWKLLATDRFGQSDSLTGKFRTSANAVSIKYLFPDSGQVTVVWDTVVGATSYNLYFAPGKTVTVGGSKIAPATSPQTVSSLTNGSTYAFIVCPVFNNVPANPSPVQVAVPQKTLVTWMPSTSGLIHSSTMVLIRAAGYSFTMGSSLPAAAYDEQPAHTVSFTHDFWMDTTDVTLGNYITMMKVIPDTIGLSCPVQNVTWFDAVLYCNARSKKEGLDTVYTYTGITGTPGNDCSNLTNISIDYTRSGYRLPTEAEWEYACRAGTSTLYYWGDDTTLAVMRQYCSFDSVFSPFPVATKKPNAYGLYDMNGNVSQWCNDWYNGSGYSAGAQFDPEGTSGGERILRGGWTMIGASYSISGSATRYESFPNQYSNPYSQPSHSLNGFRCVRPMLQTLSVPSITNAPQSQTATIGDTVTLNAFASGNPIPTYQWLKNGVPISGATLSVLSIPGSQMSDSGKYTIIASNSKGSDTSGPATLTVKPPVPAELVASTVASLKISLQWNPVAGATSYNVYRSLNGSGPFSKIDSSLSTTCTDSGLTAGTAYYFEVTAVNDSASWESAKSSPASAIPPNPWIPSPGSLQHVGQMVLVQAKGYSFTMGSNDSADDSARPPHYVTFTNDFYMDTTEVTQADYQAIMQTNPLSYQCYSCPVQNVSWYYAVLYCNARSKRDSLDTVYTYISAPGATAYGTNGFTYLGTDLTKSGYRLPTEAEWEYACRGGTSTAFYWGDDSSLAVIDTYCVFNSPNTPAATKLPNAYGLYDMSGGVWEWCNDWFGAYLPGSQTDPAGPSSGTSSVLRGGSAQNYSVSALRCANRYWDNPLSTVNAYGFRCVRRRMQLQ